jgi:hypothetical protein
LLRINHVFLVPWIVLSLPRAALFQQQLVITPILLAIGLVGMVTRNRLASSSASVILLGLIVWGKVAVDLFSLPETDSALLLLQFMIVILLMEASNATISFDRAYRQVREKRDDISEQYRTELIVWARGNLKNIGALITVATGLSLILLVLGDLVSISTDQIALSGILVLVAVVALLVLLVYGREPEQGDFTKI